MALNDIWTSKQNGIDDVLAEDINNIASSVIELEDGVTGKEDKTNKVTSITSASTDLQYPSAKAVYDTVEAKNSIFSNVLKGNAREVNGVFLKGVSPVEHNIDVNIKKANLLKYPYPETTKTENGITFTDNENGTITANGTATENSFFNLGNAEQLQLSTDFVFSASPDNSEAINKYIMTIEIEPELPGEHIYIYDNGVGAFSSQRGTVVSVFLMLKADETYNNVTFKPQLNLGNVLLPFTPYLNSTSNVEITRYGKNLVPISVSTYSNWIKENDLTYHSPYWILPEGKYSIDTKVKAGKTQVGFLYVHVSNTTDFAVKDVCTHIQAGTKLTTDFTVGVGKKYVRIWWYNNTILNPLDVYENIQVELGEDVTTYEAPITPVVYNPNVDGVVEDVKSVYPNMTLLSSINGILIDAEYNKDINIAYNELKQAIINIGGNE